MVIVLTIVGCTTQVDAVGVKGSILDIFIRLYKVPGRVETPNIINEGVEDLEEVATVEYIYKQLDGNQIKNNKLDNELPATVQNISDILSEHLTITYDNYEYYRSHIKDTADREILLSYSEGLIITDNDSRVNPDKHLTKGEVKEILGRLDKPLQVERPTYKERKNIPILMYHEIKDMPNKGLEGLYVSQNNFIKQLDALNQNGYNTVTMEQVYQHWNNLVPLPENPVVMTFDDGYLTHFNFAAPEMSKRGITGTFYIISYNVRPDSDRTPAMLREMYKQGMEIGSHTVSHVNALHTTNQDLITEYTLSKASLENILGKEVRHFCFPYGGKTNFSENLLQELGYITAPLTTYGKANANQGMTGLHRVRIDYTDSVQGFLNKIK